MKRAIVYGILAASLFYGCTSDGENEDMSDGEPGFTFQVAGEGVNRTLTGKNIQFNSTITQAKDIDGNDIEINSVFIIAQVPGEGAVEEVIISITDRTYVQSGVHSLGTDILENYNAFASYSADNTAGMTFILHDGSINLKTRSNATISGTVNASGAGTITGEFTAPNIK